MWEQTEVRAGFRGTLTYKHGARSGSFKKQVSSWSLTESRSNVKADSTLSGVAASEVGSQDVDTLLLKA